MAPAALVLCAISTKETAMIGQGAALRRRGKHAVSAIALMWILAVTVLCGGWPQSERLRRAERLARGPQYIELDTAAPVRLGAAPAGWLCEWVPAAFTGTAQQVAAASDAPATVDFSKRKPLRMIRDPYYAYSSVAVDPRHDEVVLTDENLFNIVVYDRTANTPPTAAMTEPKRVIGGERTQIEFQCGLYIDPHNGDIY